MTVTVTVTASSKGMTRSIIMNSFIFDKIANEASKCNAGQHAGDLRPGLRLRRLSRTTA